MASAAKNPAGRKVRLVVSNRYGLHLRAAAMLVKMAEAIDAQLTIECGPNRVNGKSIMSLVTLGASQGTDILAIAEGAEADKMIQAVTELFELRFYETAQAEDGALSSHHPHPGNSRESAMEQAIIQKILDRVAASAHPPSS